MHRQSKTAGVLLVLSLIDGCGAVDKTLPSYFELAWMRPQQTARRVTESKWTIRVSKAAPHPLLIASVLDGVLVFWVVLDWRFQYSF